MKKLNNIQRKEPGKGLIQLANLVAGVLVFEQLLIKGVVWWALIVGFILSIILYLLGLIELRCTY